MNPTSKAGALQPRTLQLHAASKNTASSATDHTTRKGTGGLLDRTISAGPGENRARIQSGQESSKGILPGLSKGLNSVIHSAMGLLKSIRSYSFESSKPDALSSKREMGRALKDCANRVKAAFNDLSHSGPSHLIEEVGRWIQTNVLRPMERVLRP